LSELTPDELLRLLADLISSWENEVVEFKRASNDYSTADIRKYFSALSNEVYLRGRDCGWLVFGVDNKRRRVVGTDYRTDRERLDGLKHQVRQTTSPPMSFKEIYEVTLDGHRVVMMQVPPAPAGMPVSTGGHFYARDGESLGALSIAKLDEIRGAAAPDWTAVVVEGASEADLDLEALAAARRAFADGREADLSTEEVLAWPTATFLERAKLVRSGGVTRAALLLLGRAESAHLLSPHPARMTWKLVGEEVGYEHFGPPFLLTTSALYRRIRNVQIRILPENSLLAVEVAKYDRKVVLEALHNCVAHQDYARGGKVVVTELLDRVVLENEGGFVEGLPEDYVSGRVVPRRYRNPFLAAAMAELKMIDQLGYGIHRMFAAQARRFFPMPDVDVSQGDAVSTTVYGHVIDAAYSRMLIRKSDLDLADIVALDRVQKRLAIDSAAVKRLRKAGLVEGRQPHLRVAAEVAEVTGTQVDYIRHRAQDDAFYRKQILDFIDKFGQATRPDINRILEGMLSPALSSKQKANKIKNLLSSLRRGGQIENHGTRQESVWKRGRGEGSHP